MADFLKLNVAMDLKVQSFIRFIGKNKKFLPKKSLRKSEKRVRKSLV